MFCLLEDKGVIHISEPKPGWVGSHADSLSFKLFPEQVGNKGADGGTHGWTMDLVQILTLEEEVGIFEEKLQQCDYVL